MKGEVLGLDPREVDVPVVRGHAGVTILPLLSQAKSWSWLGKSLNGDSFFGLLSCDPISFMNGKFDGSLICGLISHGHIM